MKLKMFDVDFYLSKRPRQMYGHTTDGISVCFLLHVEIFDGENSMK